MFYEIYLFKYSLISVVTNVAPDYGGDGTVGAVSTLISAMLQTFGVYLQAAILKNFSDYLIKLAALCYICSIFSAVLSTAVFGTYRKAMYLLLGPTFFYYAIQVKAPVSGTQQMMGRQVRGSIDDQRAMLKKYIVGQNPKPGGVNLNDNAEVSFAFLAFDNIISSVIQDVNELLINTAEKEDVLIKSRERIFSWLMAAYPAAPGFIKLVSLGYTGYCAEVMSKVDEIRKHRINPTDPSLEPNNLDQIGKNLRQQYEVAKSLRKINLTNETEVARDLGLNTEQEMIFSCEEIWRRTRNEAIKIARNELNKETFKKGGIEDPDVNLDRVFDQVEDAISDADHPGGAGPEEVLAAYILRTTIRKTPHDAMVTNIYDKIPFVAARNDILFKDVANAQSFGAFSRIQYFASSIPYIQGLLLLLLAAVFPFFAVFLVMPSRSMSFMIWGSLWVWVKSWDIGFAMVLVVKKIMWQFVSHNVNAFSTTIDWTRPETILELIAKNDPLASLNTYLQIAALLTCSVPLLTAHFCLGATNLFGAFRMSIDDTANKFGNKRAGIEMRLAASRAEHAQWLAMEKAGKQAYDRTLDDIGTTDPKERERKGYGAPIRTPGGDLLSARGDNSAITAAQIAREQARFDYHMSDQGMKNAAALSVFTGRQTANAYMRAARGGTVPLAAETARYGQDFRGNALGMNGNNPFAGLNLPDYELNAVPQGISDVRGFNSGTGLQKPYQGGE